jgi:hypothetical protein
MIRESTYYFPNIFHPGAEARFPHRLGRIEPFADNSLPLSVIAGANELIEQGSL